MKLPAVLLTVVAILLTLLTIVQARGCSRFPPTPCGEVENRSSHNLRYTTVLDDKCRNGPDQCDVWNSGDHGCKIRGSPLRRVGCKQCVLAPGERIGGGNIDVDAFTFADREYRVQIRGGTARNVAKGVWTKIASSDTAICQDNSILNKPACFVDIDPTIKDVGEERGYDELLMNQHNGIPMPSALAATCPKPSSA